MLHSLNNSDNEILMKKSKKSREYNQIPCYKIIRFLIPYSINSIKNSKISNNSRQISKQQQLQRETTDRRLSTLTKNRYALETRMQTVAFQPDRWITSLVRNSVRQPSRQIVFFLFLTVLYRLITLGNTRHCD